MRRHFQKLLTLVLMSALPSVNVYATASAAMLRSSGGVSVNGTAVTPITTVFVGDRIETGPNAAGSLSLSGSSILVDRNSNLIFTAQEMDFSCGGGTVQTTQGLSAHFGRLAVKPAQQEARFHVQQTGAVLKVSALEGDLSVFDGAKNVNLPAGNAMSVPYSGCVQMAQNESADGITNTAGPNQAAPTPDPTPAPSDVGTTASLIAPAVVISVAIAAIIAVSQNPVSPSGP